MPPDGAPEGGAPTVQVDPFAESMAEVSQELGRSFGEEPPEASAPATGQAPGQATPPDAEGGTPPAAEEPDPLEGFDFGTVDWNDEQSRRAALVATIRQRDEAAERRLADQRVTFTREARENAAREQALKEVLTELEDLYETSPAMWAEKVSNNPHAMALWAQHRASQGLNPQVELRQGWANEQTALIYEAIPWLKDEAAKLAQQGPEVIARELPNGNVYGFIAKTAAQRAVEEFKASPEYKAALEAERRAAVHDNLPGVVGGPPSVEQRRMPAGSPTVDTGDPLRDALAEAAQEAGRSFDVSLVSSGRRPNRR